MSARTCLLCGKSLSRFLTGPGDFCSREHRNQYQTRLGMDRLNEANKVANLMRRRENAKLISAKHLISDCARTPREFGRVSAPPSLPSVVTLRPTPAGLPAPRVPVNHDDSRWLVAARPVSSATPSMARLLLAEVGFGHKAVLHEWVQAHRLAVAIIQAPISTLINRPAAPTSQRREFGLLRHSAVRVHLDTKLHIGGTSCGFGATGASHRSRGVRILRRSAAKGKALRVSSGVGFRLRPPVRPSFASAGPGPTLTPRFEQPCRVTFRALGVDGTVRTAGMRLERVELSYRPPVILNETVSLQRGTLARLSCAAQALNGGARICTSPWAVAEPQLPRLDTHSGSTGFTSAGSTQLLSTAPDPAAIVTDQRPARVSFVHNEVPFTYSTTAIYGSFSGGATAPPPHETKPIAPTATRIEEHFNNGFAQWTGGLGTWKLDAAGVRIGELALLQPSLEWADYDLEFLARIENRCMSWVFRAANLNEYYQATIAKTAGGYEFSRCTVVGGHAEPVTALMVPGIGPGSAPSKTAITVRMRARGEQFSVSIDNRVVESWSDIRLPVGGVGFMGSLDDRARLYWVTISPVGSLNKEQWKQ
jgi:hypothetical protein